jgi:hypothetical protein
MNLMNVNARDLNKELERLEREHKQARAAAEAQRQADEVEAAEAARVEAERLAVEQAKREQREALVAAEAEAAAAVNELHRQIEQARLEGLRVTAEQSDAGKTFLARVEADAEEYGVETGDHRSGDIALQSARLFADITGIATSPELWAANDAWWAEATIFGLRWTATFPPNEGRMLYVHDKNHAPRMVEHLGSLAPLVACGDVRLSAEADRG